MPESENESRSQDNTAALTDAAMQAWQFRKQPFSDLPADGDLFVDNAVTEQIAEIKDALITGDDLLLVIGETGSGKSTLLKQLTNNSGNRLQCFSVRGSNRFSAYNLFAGLLEAFKLKAPVDMEDTLKEVVPCLQALLDRNTLGVIVLDDADRVRPEELARLLGSMRYLNGGEETLLRVLLAAEPEFEMKLPEILPTGADLPYASLAIEPFDINRTVGYIEFRLNQAGHFEPFPFNDRQLAQIVERAGARPAALNAAAASVLNEMAMPQAQQNDENRTAAGALLTNPAMRAALAIAAIALLGAALYQFLPQNSATPEAATDNTPEYGVVIEKPVATDVGRIALVNETENTTAPSTANESASSAGITDRQTGVVPSPQAPPATSATDAAGQAANTIVKNVEADQPATAVVVDEQNDDPSTQQSNSEANAANTETEPAASGLESANWILVQDPGRFTIQMSASPDRPSVAYFLEVNPLNAPNSIYSYQRNDQTWYALIHGLFPSIAEARAAIEAMPESAKRNQPWIRSVRQIQDLVRKP